MGKNYKAELDNYVLAECTTDGCPYRRIMYKDETEDCDYCDTDKYLERHPVSTCYDAEVILDVTSGILESMNYHREAELPYVMYYELKRDDNDYEMAKSIAKILLETW